MNSKKELESRSVLTVHGIIQTLLLIHITNSAQFSAGPKIFYFATKCKILKSIKNEE